MTVMVASLAVNMVESKGGDIVERIILWAVILTTFYSISDD